MFNFKTDQAAIDLWSIPHFLSGILVGLPAFYFGLSLVPAFAVLIALSLLVEFIENFFRVYESFANHVADLILGIVAFVIAYYIFTNFSSTISLFVFIFAAILDALTAIPGWLRYIERRQNTTSIK